MQAKIANITMTLNSMNGIKGTRSLAFDKVCFNVTKSLIINHLIEFKEQVNDDKVSNLKIS